MRIITTFRNSLQHILLLSLLCICLSTFNLFAQKQNQFTNNKQVYDEQNVDNKPSFPGGVNALNKFIAANYTMPDLDSYNGKVIISFIVEPDGLLSDFTVIKDIGYGTGNEAIRVIQKAPKWTAGILDGKPVRVLVSFPITLKSEED